MKLGGTILSLRREAGYTQERLSEMLGVSTTAVSKWECGQTCPDIELLPKLAEIFECSVDYLLGCDGTNQASVEAVNDCMREYSTMVSWINAYLFGREESDEVLRESLRAAEVLEKFNDGSVFSDDISAFYESAAFAYAKKGDFDACLANLERAADAAISYDKSAGTAPQAKSTDIPDDTMGEHQGARRASLCSTRWERRSGRRTTASDAAKDLKRLRQGWLHVNKTIGTQFVDNARIV